MLEITEIDQLPSGKGQGYSEDTMQAVKALLNGHSGTIRIARKGMTDKEVSQLATSIRSAMLAQSERRTTVKQVTTPNYLFLSTRPFIPRPRKTKQ